MTVAKTASRWAMCRATLQQVVSSALCECCTAMMRLEPSPQLFLRGSGSFPETAVSAASQTQLPNSRSLGQGREVQTQLGKNRPRRYHADPVDARGQGRDMAGVGWKFG
ncbi:MAG: hypothetical protein F4X12_16890 [Acidobacteriia bacterium]|nr:hypothetical protein [Terriglobia bacterium]